MSSSRADELLWSHLQSGMQESADPLENLVRQAMFNYNLPQPKAAVWLPEGPKVDQSLLVRSHPLICNPYTPMEMFKLMSASPVSDTTCLSSTSCCLRKSLGCCLHMFVAQA